MARTMAVNAARSGTSPRRVIRECRRASCRGGPCPRPASSDLREGSKPFDDWHIDPSPCARRGISGPDSLRGKPGDETVDIGNRIRPEPPIFRDPSRPTWIRLWTVDWHTPRTVAAWATVRSMGAAAHAGAGRAARDQDGDLRSDGLQLVHCASQTGLASSDQVHWRNRSPARWGGKERNGPLSRDAHGPPPGQPRWPPPPGGGVAVSSNHRPRRTTRHRPPGLSEGLQGWTPMANRMATSDLPGNGESPGQSRHFPF
jgi:hypothetical protein